MLLTDILALIHQAKNAQFASITYRNDHEELAKHMIILGADTTVLYKKDVEILKTMLGDLLGVRREACLAILLSRQESLIVGVGNNSQYVHSPQNADTYVYIDGLIGIRVHKDNGSLYVNGLSQSKIILEAGKPYKTVKSSPLTLAKREIMKNLPSNRFRQFILKNVTRCACNGEVLEIDNG